MTICVCVYLGFGRLAIWLVISAITHELGHVVYLLLRRRKIRNLRFNLLGACMETVPLSYADEMLCAISGPFINLILYMILLHHDGVPAILNLGLFLFNMLPIYPLDGGRILRAALLCFLQDGTVKRIVRVIGFVFSLLLMLGAVSLCILLQQGIVPMVFSGVVILKLNYDAQREGY